MCVNKTPSMTQQVGTFELEVHCCVFLGSLPAYHSGLVNGNSADVNCHGFRLIITNPFLARNVC